MVQKDEQQSTNMAERDAKPRSQPKEIERLEATAFTNTNISLLTPGKQNQNEGSCKRNEKDKIFLADFFQISVSLPNKDFISKFSFAGNTLMTSNNTLSTNANTTTIKANSLTPPAPSISTTPSPSKTFQIPTITITTLDRTISNSTYSSSTQDPQPFERICSVVAISIIVSLILLVVTFQALREILLER